MEIRILSRLDDLPAAEWDRLRGPDRDPFLSHAFLAGLERHGCVGAHWGWTPQHLTLWDGGRLAGAVPLYLKHNSYGELVFDGAWADAFQRSGGRYYPKLVAAVPYSPVTGPRLLVEPDSERPDELAALLAEGALEHARSLGVSSLHILFPTPEQGRGLAGGHPFLARHDCQFHWHNRGYRDFEDFLDRFNAQRRKQVRRERRRVEEAGVELRVLHGHEVSEEQWAQFHRFYEATFDKRGGYPTLSLAFFRDLARRLGERVVLFLAVQQGQEVAGAFCLRSGDTLYGRHWGCMEEFHSLHFEACYYRGIDYCIRHGLARFEPGAQGEHKVWRGFEPTLTWSAHWLADPGFHRTIGRHLERERGAVAQYAEEMRSHLPFRQSS